jgi:signal transduction histidine kinase
MPRLGRATASSWATASAAAAISCILLMGPVLLFGAFVLRTSLEDLNVRLDAERLQTATLSAVLVGKSMSARADVLQLFSTRDDVHEELRQRDARALTVSLAQLFGGRTDLASVAVLDANGILLARQPGDPVIGQSFAERAEFKGALGSTKPFVGEAFVTTAQTASTVVAMTYAVRESDVVLGVVLFTMRPELLAADLQPSAGLGSREVLLLDAKSQVLATTAARQPLAAVTLGRASGPTLITVNGETRTYSVAGVPGASWSLYVLDTPSDVYGAQIELARQLGSPLVWALLGAGLIAGVLSVGFLLIRDERRRLATANRQLTMLNTTVEAATRAKSDFLANMSHELRTPLNAVLGFSDVLLEQLHDTLSDRQIRYLANIHSAGQHLLELINDVLDLSKVEAGRMQLRPEVVTLPALLEPVIASTAQLAADRGIRFEAPDVPKGSALVDAGRVRQILLNLLSNAIKFTRPGGNVRFLVSVDKGALRFEVIDDGIGIPASEQSRVFGVFERLHEGRSEAAGTGLGLAITKKLVELQHGLIDFSSVEGVGTRFWITLEDVMVEASVGPRVLIVEDDPSDAQLIGELVRETGLRVEVAPTVSGALSAIARSLPTAVILDLRLPDRRGDDVLRSLKSDPRTARVAVLVVTVEDDDGRLRLLGADHMTKPIDRERLRRWLMAVGAGGGALARVAG